MADLISRAAALDAIDHERDVLIEEKRLGAEHIVVHHARRIIEELPAVDAVPVVRCRDCVHCFSVESDPLTPYDGESAWYCDRYDFDVDVLALDPCRFYCADGERRDEDADN